MDVSVVSPDGEVDHVLAVDPDERPQLPVPEEGVLDIGIRTGASAKQPRAATQGMTRESRDVLPSNASAEVPARLCQNQVLGRAVTGQRHPCQSRGRARRIVGGGDRSALHIAGNGHCCPVSWQRWLA